MSFKGVLGPFACMLTPSSRIGIHVHLFVDPQSALDERPNFYPSKTASLSEMPVSPVENMDW